MVGRIESLEGRAVGPYHDLTLVGRGAMADVYRAWHSPLKRWVAIKVLQAELCEQPDFLARFHREAELVGRLEHPHILPVFDTGEIRGVPYLVMPFISLGTLDARLRHEPALSLSLVVKLMGQLCEALYYAHTRPERIVHRDVKPNNVLLEREDHVLLSDFGIAKMLGAPALLQITRTGVLGTPEYMAPEQGLQQPVDGRTDVYSLAVMLFEILTGRLPFTGKTQIEILYRHVSAPVPSARAINPTITEAWERVLQCALAKNPAERFPNTRALHAAMLEAYQARSGADVHTSSTPVRREPPLGRLYQDAEHALSSEDWALAIRLCEQMLAHAPRSAVAEALKQHAVQRLEEARQREGARREVTGYLQAGAQAAAAADWSAAHDAYQMAVQAAPDNAAALAALRQAQWEKWCADGYAAAQADLAAERWSQAIEKLDVLVRERADYRDAAAMRQRAQESLETDRWLAGWYDYGLAALRNGDAARAADAFDHVLRRRRGYRDAERQYAIALAAQERNQTRAALRAHLEEADSGQIARAPMVRPQPSPPARAPERQPSAPPLVPARSLRETPPAPPRVALDRRAVLAALHKQGLAALQRGDHRAAAEALHPVAEEAADRFPDARERLLDAQRGLSSASLRPVPAALALPAPAPAPGIVAAPLPPLAAPLEPSRGGGWGWWVVAGVAVLAVLVTLLIVLPMMGVG